ncbi:MAG: hypothetical protein R2734_14135 [Nocardioides sp.]
MHQLTKDPERSVTASPYLESVEPALGCDDGALPGLLLGDAQPWSVAICAVRRGVSRPAGAGHRACGVETLTASMLSRKIWQKISLPPG